MHARLIGIANINKANMAAPADHEPLTQHELDEFVDERVSDNYRLLSNLLEELKREREQLLLRVSV